jgi:transcription initiation factor TFIID subunit 2
MDFGAINQRLSQSKYETMQKFYSDTLLVFRNYRQFNPPTTYPHNCADAVGQLFNKEWAKMVGKRSLLGIISQLLREDM